MAKSIELSIYSPVRMVEPANFISTVEGIGRDVFEKVSETGENIRSWTTGMNYSEANRSLIVTPAESLRYYHLSLMQDKIGTIALDFLGVAMQLDPGLMDETSEGESIISSARSLLREKLGFESINGQICDFNEIAVVSSKKYPHQTIFALKHNPKFSQGYECEAVKLIDDHTRTRVDEISAANDSHIPRDIATHGIEATIPFARTKERDSARIQEFLDTFTSNLFDPTVIVEFDELDIK